MLAALAVLLDRRCRMVSVAGGGSIVIAPAEEEEEESLRTCTTGERERKRLFVIGGDVAKVLVGGGVGVTFGRVEDIFDACFIAGWKMVAMGMMEVGACDLCICESLVSRELMMWLSER